MCLVPERAFSRAPVDIHLVYLCRFEVRAPYELLRGFSWQREIGDFMAVWPRDRSDRRMTPWIFLRDPAYTEPSGHPSPDSRILLRHPIVITPARWGRNVDLLSISYAFRPVLRTRLTLSGLTFLRK